MSCLRWQHWENNASQKQIFKYSDSNYTTLFLVTFTRKLRFWWILDTWIEGIVSKMFTPFNKLNPCCDVPSRACGRKDIFPKNEKGTSDTFPYELLCPARSPVFPPFLCIHCFIKDRGQMPGFSPVLKLPWDGYQARDLREEPLAQWFTMLLDQFKTEYLYSKSVTLITSTTTKEHISLSL